MRVAFLMCVFLACEVNAQDITDRQALRRTPVVEVFEAAHKAVVNISSTQTVKSRSSPFDLIFEDIIPEFRRSRDRQLTSVGSGFVIHESGYIVTNAHVVDRTANTTAILADQSTFDAQIVASDPEHDIALLRIQPPHPLPTLALGRSHDLMIGETVIAIGNPLGFEHTLTRGVISATHRELELYSDRAKRKMTYHDLIQTDASINPGSSGGPLLNILGELIGINTAIRSDAQNIGFAIPVETLYRILPNMMERESNGRFMLGLSMDARATVTRVLPDSPADRSGVVVGDVITSIDRKDTRTRMDVLFELIDHHPGDRLLFGLRRNGRTINSRISLDAPPRPDGVRLAAERLGLELQPLPPQSSRDLRGLIVTQVERRGPAGKAGIHVGDILTVLDQYFVRSIDDVGLILEDIEEGTQVYMRILRAETGVYWRDWTYVKVR